MDDNYNVIDNLEKVRVELTDDMEQKVNYYETELEKMRALRDQEIAALEATVQDQEEELFSLKEYKESKTMVEESMRTLAQELEEEKKFRELSSKCCVCNSEDLDNRWKESVLHLEGKLCDICYFKELLIRGGLPLAASN